MTKARALRKNRQDRSFNMIWAILRETSRSQKETERLMKENSERQKENAKYQKETDRQMKEYNKRFGDFTNRFGEVVEYMIAPNLLDKFNELGFAFTKISTRSKYRDQDNGLFFEIDYVLENEEKAILVEVKTKLLVDYINQHIERIEKTRRYADSRNDKRVFLGAVAGVVIPDNVRDYALKMGLFVIEPSGETFNITYPRGKPKEW